MLLKSLVLSQVRNFSDWHTKVGQTVVICGQNGIGKTTIIEAMYLLATGSSFRADKIEEVIHLGQELARVKGEVETTDGERITLELLITRGIVQGKRTQSRLYSVNGIRRRKQDFVGQLAAVVFRPEDMRLIEGSPSRRRSFLDAALTVTDPAYARALAAYEKTLRSRNRLLQQIAEGRQSKNSLSFWNLSLVQHGEYLQKKRSEFLHYLQTIGFRFTLQVTYIPSLISEARVAEYLDRELIVGHSLIGPHKDDFSVVFPGSLLDETSTDWLEIAKYGSRGQQRLAVLWLKLGELEYVRHKLGVQPMLLLDDILSELDHESRAIVFELLETYQTVITTADDETLSEIREKLPNSELIQLD